MCKFAGIAESCNCQLFCNFPKYSYGLKIFNFRYQLHVFGASIVHVYDYFLLSLYTGTILRKHLATNLVRISNQLSHNKSILTPFHSLIENVQEFLK